MMTKLRWLLPALMLGACATQPPVELATGTFTDITPLAAQTRNLTGSRVRWGGTVASVSPKKNETCFQLVGHSLNSDARPKEEDKSDGRFMACASGFYDPAIFTVGREVTVVGILQTPIVGKIGDYDYRFPLVSVEAIYLWPKREPRVNYSTPYYPLWYSPGPWMMGPMGPW